VRLLNMPGEAQAALTAAVEAVLQRTATKRVRSFRRQEIDHLELESRRRDPAAGRPSNPWPRPPLPQAAMKISNDLSASVDHASISRSPAERLLASRPIVRSQARRDGPARTDARRRARRVVALRAGRPRDCPATTAWTRCRVDVPNPAHAHDGGPHTSSARRWSYSG